MKKNRTILIITLILLIIALVLIFSRRTTTLSKKDSAFAVEDTSLVTRIFIADKNNNQVLLERQDDGSWLIDGKYKAHDVKVQSFLQTLKDIKVRMPVARTGRDGVIKRMAAIARKIEIYETKPRINLFDKIRLFTSERNTKTYYIGDVTQDNQGTYMLMEGSDEPYVVYLPNLRGFVSPRYSPDPDEWREHVVFQTNYKNIDKIKMEFPIEPEKSYQITVKDDRDIILESLMDGQRALKYDTARMLGFLTSFRDIRYESILTNEPEKSYIDSVLTSKPITIITLTTRDGQVNQVKIFPKAGFSRFYDQDGALLEPFDLDRAYALVNNGQDIVLVQYFVFDRIMRPLQYLKGEM